MICIVDDDEGARDSLRLLLELEGLEAREFASAWNFLACVQAGEGDCLILDVHMPEMSGLELLETLRGHGDTRPVIIVSGRLDAVARKRAYTAGALAVVEKPYETKEILRLVRLALDQRRQPPGQLAAPK